MDPQPEAEQPDAAADVDVGPPPAMWKLPLKSAEDLAPHATVSGWIFKQVRAPPPPPSDRYPAPRTPWPGIQAREVSCGAARRVAPAVACAQGKKMRKMKRRW